MSLDHLGAQFEQPTLWLFFKRPVSYIRHLLCVTFIKSTKVKRFTEVTMASKVDLRQVEGKRERELLLV